MDAASPQDDCPDDDVLVAFASGGLGDDDLARVAQHIERCPACMKVVASPDEFVRNLQRIHQEGVTPWSDNLSVRIDVPAGEYFFNVDHAAPTNDPEQFFDALARSGLFDAEDMKDVRREWKAYRSTDLGAFAQTLALEGRLTEFHVRQLLRGKTRGWVLNDYVILHPLGAGGIGWVFRARHRRQNRTFALKVTPPHLARSTSTSKRFEREIEIIKKLRHPRLITAVDAGEADGISYLIMEEMSGHSLAEWVELNGPMRVLTAVDMVRQATEGIAAAHDASVIHRDLTPSVLWMEVFTGSGRFSAGGPGVKVLDFGLAHTTAAEASQKLSAANQPMVGTPGYVAPEQARDSRAADARSDVYSLGCTLYYLLSGKAPFLEPHVGRVSDPSRSGAESKPSPGSLGDGSETRPTKVEPLPPLESPREPVPPALQSIYRRMVARSPGDRYQSADDLLQDLDAFLAGTKISSPRPKWLTIALAALAAAVVIVAILWWPRTGTVDNVDGIVRVAGPLPAPLDGPASRESVTSAQKAWAAALGLPVEIVNRQGMKLRLVPPGAMELGTPAGQIDDRLGQLVPGSSEWQWLNKHGRMEQPLHRFVSSESFYLGTTEVTVGQFRAFVEGAKYQTRAEADGLGGIRSGKESRQSPALTWRTPGFATQSEASPVVQLESADAEAYCRWLSEVDRRPYALPNEDQWEFACRAGRAERWFWGDDAEAFRDYVAGADSEPSAVAQKKPNALGLFDMSGNVAEWCAGGTVARGGAFVHPLPDGVASAARLEPTDRRQDFVGFRVMMKIKIEKK